MKCTLICSCPFGKSMGKSEFPLQELVQTINQKKNYTVRYITLKFNCLGTKISHIHRILEFGREKGTEPYIKLRTEMRSRTTNSFQQSFHKLKNNDCYEKILESKCNRVNIKLPVTANSRSFGQIRKVLLYPLKLLMKISLLLLVARAKISRTIQPLSALAIWALQSITCATFITRLISFE